MCISLCLLIIYIYIYICICIYIYIMQQFSFLCVCVTMAHIYTRHSTRKRKTTTLKKKKKGHQNLTVILLFSLFFVFVFYFIPSCFSLFFPPLSVFLLPFSHSTFRPSSECSCYGLILYTYMLDQTSKQSEVKKKNAFPGADKRTPFYAISLARRQCRHINT